MRLTAFQWIPLVAFIGYLFYAFYLVPGWEATLPARDPVIRMDLALLYPVLWMMVVIPVVQATLKKKISKK